MTSGPDFKPKNSFYWLHDVDAKLQLRRKGGNSTVKISESTFNVEPAIAAKHGPHSLVRIGPGCAGRR